MTGPTSAPFSVLSHISDNLAVIAALLSAAAAIATALLSYFHNRRRTFIDAVTAERMKWISGFREDVSEFIGLLYRQIEEELSSENSDHMMETWQNLRAIACRIRLRLNRLERDSSYDERLLAIIDRITVPESERITRSNVDEIAHSFAADAQAYLKIEWERVKLEAQKGRLVPKEWEKKRDELLKQMQHEQQISEAEENPCPEKH